jgi:chromosomal replication initiator protein
MSELWTRARNELRRGLSDESFDVWIAPVEFGGLKDGAAEIRVPTNFHGEWVTNNFGDLILAAFRDQMAATPEADEKPPTRLVWQVDERLMDRMPIPERNTAPARAPEPTDARRAAQASAKADRGTFPPEALGGLPARSDLNPKYSFDNFVVGASNQLAHAASVAAADEPGRRYNPLFIYGGVGLGKTHLVNAIGHTILRQRPGSRILYVSAERFTNEFIWSLQNHRINDFRSRYRTKCDVLLMDDIQFLAGRDQTQEEFFHTFNALYHSDKQIVVTSDVYPQQIAEMEERLISRFQSGMVADIQPPELDTRVAILMKKAELEKIPLSSEVAHFLAQVVKSNVRELEGTLLRLAVKAELLNHPIDLDLARDTMRAVLPKPETATTVEDIQRAVCNYFGIRLSDLKSKRRHRTVSFPRMVAMYICRQRLGTSYPELGERFGGKDHTTVISAVRKIGGLVEAEDEKVVGSIDAIERKLGV